MRLVVIGVNHKTAPVALRERLAFVGDDVTTALRQLKSMSDGCVIVSTCNRTEIYALLPQSIAEQSDGIEQIKSWLAQFKGMAFSEIQAYLYTHQNSHALTHWLRVASGLDSMILGEPQILGQIKQAVQLAQSQQALSSQLSWVIDQVFAAAKRVRSDTQVGAQAVSLGFAAAKLVTQIFDDIASRTLLVVAAGEMNRLVATHIAGLGVGRIIVCNRSPERAQALAAELAAPNRRVEVRGLDALAEVLSEADIVSSCSGSMDALIDKAMTITALKRRRYQPILMVDLAVPRDIEPSIGQLDDVYLYSVDDLQHVIAGNLEQRRQAAVDAELLVSQLVVEMERRFQVRQVGRDIQAYRARTQDQVAQLVAQSLQKLESGEQSAEQTITELSRRLSQTLSHAPSKLMRKAAREGDSALLDFVVTGLHDAYRK
ncbi:glutamyl-tRNA reductase [Psychrobacter ciconiae]|uniref:glutamyl-tRNA reductase n=1 Tax=Psychrobacter ciconiae TaxID=1553449 RepID=UPI001919D20E|nr:glutamyl-tRNA reductase [Psychrobacter ciconiae]